MGLLYVLDLGAISSVREFVVDEYACWELDLFLEELSVKVV